MWQTIRIADFGSVITGKTPSSNNPEHFGDDYPFITPTDMDKGRIVHPERGISQEGFLKFRRQILPRRSVCFVCIGATIGKICLTTEKSLTNQQINSVVVDTTKHDPFFIYYLLSTYAEAVKGIAGGAATPIVNKTSFENIEVVVPPLPTQRKIAAILSAYDDLIENNLRRIKILEEMAQNLYREWFVKFRFPGHQQARFVDSPLGRIPEGWEVVSLGNLIKLRKDKFQENLHSECPLLDLAKMQQRTLSVAETGNPSELTTSRIIFEEDDILFGSIRPYLHKVALAPCRGVTNVSVLVIRPAEKNLQSFLAVLLSSIDTIRWADQHSTGTKMPVIKWEALQTMPALLPSQAVLRVFETSVQPMLQTVKMTSSRNQNLRRTRDLLLPKLISGEVDVSELDITIPEEAV